MNRTDLPKKKFGREPRVFPFNFEFLPHLNIFPSLNLPLLILFPPVCCVSLAHQTL